MNRQQSIISAIVTFLIIFVAPRLSSHGIELDEASATAIVTGLLGILAWAWATWKNHNYTDDAVMRQMEKKEDNAYEEFLEDDIDDDDIDGDGDM